MALSVDAFKNKYLGKKLDYDGYYGGQCVDMVNFYNKLVVGGGFIGTPTTGGARDWWENYNNSAEAKKRYVRIGKGDKPQKGDIPVWGAGLGNYYGHIAVYLGSGKILNQNNAGRQYLTVDNMFTKGLLGYLRPRKFIAASKPKKSNEAVAKEIVAGKGGWGNGTDRVARLKKAGYNPSTVQAIVNKLVNAKKKPTSSKVYYTVKKGDTLSGIAAKYKTTWQNLQKMNGIKNPNVIKPGQKLRVK